MRILVGWDQPAEAELLALYLSVGDHEVKVITQPSELLDQAHQHPWDAALLSLSFPDTEGAFALFQELRQAQPDCPIIGACHPVEVFRVARFMTNGLRSYVLRDGSGDYLFMIRSVIESVFEAVQAEREQKIAERLRQEIESVRKFQESIIPHDLRCPAGYNCCARYEPSQIQVLGGKPVVMAGGDYYDVFALDEHSVVILVGDASGHGMKACMSIITMHTLVRMIRGQRYRNTAEFVGEINRRLCQQSILQEDGGFITLFYGILRADERIFQWTSAGHPLPLLQHARGGPIAAIGTPRHDADLPLGIDPSAEFGCKSTPVPPGSRLLLYTDGLVEAFHHAKDHQEYGVAGVMETLHRTQGEPLPAALQALFDDSYKFTGGAGRHDDTSVVLLERLE